MHILDVQVLNGPNYWSINRKKLIVLTIDLKKYETLPTNKLPGFSKALRTLIPTLQEHRCSKGVPGGFLQRLEEGTWLGHVIEHVALELQELAGMEAGFGRTYGAKKVGVYQVIFSYEIEEAGLFAAQAAFNLVQSLAAGESYTALEADLKALTLIRGREQFGPSTKAIVAEAKRRNIPVKGIKNSSIILLGQGCRQTKMWATLSSKTPSLAVDIAANKELTKNILQSHFIPVPKGMVIQDLDQLGAAIQTLGFPLVIKPLYGNHGRGVFTGITTKDKAIIGFELAQKISKNILVEQFIEGNDYRLLVINHKFVAAAKRSPAQVIGDGVHTIQELIDKVNRDPKRGVGHENLLTKIIIDEVMLALLTEKNLNLDTVLPVDKVVYLKGTANLSAGGTAADVTALVHPEIIQLAERIARLINLDICGIDIVADTLTRPLSSAKAYVIEVNAGPGLRMHLEPSEGEKRNVAAPILDMLYPVGAPATIPVVAVTGTNGKTTVVRLIAHFAKYCQHQVGFTTTDGIYIQDKLVYSGDCSGPLSAATVLNDPLVNFAVLECARGGILRAGLVFDECDISIITNVTGDHLGLKEIHSLDELLKLKAVVAYSTKKEGYAILNAADDRVYSLKSELSCQVALFSVDENTRIHSHCAAGGLSCFLEEDCIVVQRGKVREMVASTKEIPLTFNGTATCMIQNILPAVLAGVISGFSTENIVAALKEFVPSSDNLPGRMNVFHFPESDIMIDYAHNEGAYIALQEYAHNIHKKKVGIITAPGDRLSSDIQKIGYYAACIFDEIIIRQDKNCRGTNPVHITNLIKEGIESAKTDSSVQVIPDEFEALQFALAHHKNSFIFYTAEDVFKAIDFVKQIQANLPIGTI